MRHPIPSIERGARRRAVRLLIRSAFAVILFGTVGATTAFAHPHSHSSSAVFDHGKRGHFAVEFDPITTALGARNVLFYVHPSGLDHWAVGAIAIRADFPEWLGDIMSYRNRDEDFDSEIEWSPGLVADYYFDSGPRERWHAGVFSFFFRYDVMRNGDRARFTNHVLLPRVGYRWFPSENWPIYLDPFGGLMIEHNLSGDRTIDGSLFRPTPILPFASVHLGLRF